MYKPRYYKKYAKSFVEGMTTAARYAKPLQMIAQGLSQAQSKASASVKPVYKKKTNMKKSYKPKNKTNVKSLKKDVRKIQRSLNNSLSRFAYRLESANTISCAVSQQTYQALITNSVSTLETVLANGRFFNPSVPGTLITASLASATYAQKVKILSQYTKVSFRNNYQVPCLIKVMAWVPKADTSISSATAFTSGIADNAGGALTATDVNVYPSDSKQLVELYKLDNSAKVVLQPGQEFDFVYSFKECMYDPAYYDSHNLAYQKALGGVNIDCIIQGVLGHDSTVTTEHGLLQAQCDYRISRTFKVEYDAGGVDLDYVVISNTLDTFTNGGLVSNMPIADNQGYSLN